MNKFKLCAFLFIQASCFAMLQGMSETPNQLLLRSARLGDIGLKNMKKAIEAGADIDAVNEKGDTAFVLLASRGHLYGTAKSVPFLISQGADIYKKGGDNLN